ncbi:MAG: hypothetical protein K2M30_01280 [Desulfovibrionaceae bacterium]|nr:hypothetical protein [Desulfovibrionaceae bacterium]
MPVFSLNYNQQATTASKALKQNESALQTAVQRLSTGKKFNAPSDGPASFSLLSKMGSDILIGQQGVVNAQNGTSMLDTADAALANIEKIFTDIGVLAEDAANGIWNDEQRAVFDSQAKSLLSVADNIALSTNFNGTNILTGAPGANGGTGNLQLTLQVGTSNSKQDQIKLEFSSARTATLVTGGATNTIDLATADGALKSVGTVETALKNIRTQREQIGQAQKAMEYNISNRESMNEQLSSTISNIGDADIAQEMENYTNYTAKAQASQYMYIVSMQNPSKIAQMIQSV